MSTGLRMLRTILPGWLLAAAVAGAVQAVELHSQEILVDGKRQQVRVPQGYTLELLTADLDGPRLMTFMDNGDLLIGSRSGAVYRLAPPYRRAEVLVELDDYPHSVAYRNGLLYIAQTNGLYRTRYVPGQKTIPRASVTRLVALPGGRGHTSRTVGIGPDDRIYVSLGISHNCSDQYLGTEYPFEDRRGGVLVLNESGAEPHFEPFAAGLRNPVGFDWQPQTGVLYATNNGPDHLGFGQPPEYFSRLEKGSFHGMPWFQYDGRSLQRDRCVRSRPPRPQTEVTLPVATFPARNAPLGMAFVPEGALEERFRGDAMVALHGSWGTPPSGSAFGDRAGRRPPAIVRVRFADGTAQGVETFIDGFQSAGGSRWARPAGVAIGPDGALYFTSDSETNGLFRLRRSRPSDSGQ